MFRKGAWVAQKVWYFYSSSFYTFLSMAGVNVVATTHILTANSAKQLGNILAYSSIIFTSIRGKYTCLVQV